MSGRGKGLFFWVISDFNFRISGGKGLGKGGAKRHRKVSSNFVLF
jgi:hypothetical protein